MFHHLIVRALLCMQLGQIKSLAVVTFLGWSSDINKLFADLAGIYLIDQC